jgi:hypothetical protein
MRRGSALIELPLVALLLAALAGVAFSAAECVRHGAMTPRAWAGLVPVALLAAVLAWLVAMARRAQRSG